MYELYNWSDGYRQMFCVPICNDITLQMWFSNILFFRILNISICVDKVNFSVPRHEHGLTQKYKSATKWHLNENAYSPVRFPPCMHFPQFRFMCLYVDTRVTVRSFCNVARNERIKQHFCSNYYLSFRRILSTANVKSRKCAEGYSVTFKERWSSLAKSSKTVLLSPVLRNTNQFYLTRMLLENTMIIPSFRCETLITQAANSLINHICVISIILLIHVCSLLYKLIII